MASEQLKFVPFSSVVDATFWHMISDKKLNELKLDERPLPIHGVYRNDGASGLPSLVSVDYESFQNEISPSLNAHRLHGNVIVTNTIEEFKSKDKQQLLDQFGTNIWDAIHGQGNINSDDLNRFLLLTYLDLKKFVFYYWFAFPAFATPSAKISTPPSYLKDNLTEPVRRAFEQKYYDSAPCLRSYFLVHLRNGNELSLHDINDLVQLVKQPDGQVFVGFADPSTSKDYPGWPLRNLLALLASRSPLTKQWSVICLRMKARSSDFSLVLNIELDELLASDESKLQQPSKCVGWEKNEKQKLLPRQVDMSSILDPSRLAQNAVNLNLKLMRWRLVPELDLERLAKVKCLLLGAGTLGCNVARALLGWGVETITFVDNSKVSYSNPVRQSLFNFEDCLNGGKAKAIAAAESLKRIYPNVYATGVTLSIPMPGHFLSESSAEAIKRDVESLEKLICEHDCIFLLMDTRESRWLPTVLGQAHNKLVINAALGFDTFLVQRHGVRKIENDAQESAYVHGDFERAIPGSELGCYFCNDVVAPGNSTKDRTLDQQCTVTRPGISMIAGGLAVELMVSVVQHKEFTDAPAPSANSENENDSESCLGIVPHQIRGFLSRFQEVLPSTYAFKQCAACSSPVINAYREQGFDFLQKVFNEPTFLEELTGLKKLHEETNMHEVWALSDDDNDSISSASIS